MEWESDRGRFLGRGRGPEDPQALDGRPLSGTTGVLIDPIVSLRQRVRLAPGGVVRLSFATGMASSRETALALAQRYREPSATARTFALAFAHAQSRRRHLGITSEEALLFERLASRVLYSDGSLRPAPEVLARSTLGQEGLWAHGVSGDLPILLVRVVSDVNVPLVRQVLQAQEYWRLEGLSADVVILNEHPVSYLDEVHARLAALLDDGPWRAWQHKPGGAYLLRGDRMTEPERLLLSSVARAVLSSDRGTLAQQLDLNVPSRPEPMQRSSLRAGEPAPRSTRTWSPRCRRSRSRTGSAASPTAGGSTSSSSRETRRRRCRGRTSSRAPPSGPSSRRRAPRSPGPRTAARTGSPPSRTIRSPIRRRRRSSSATTTAARRGRPPPGPCPAPGRADGS